MSQGRSHDNKEAKRFTRHCPYQHFKRHGFRLQRLNIDISFRLLREQIIFTETGPERAGIGASYLLSLEDTMELKQAVSVSLLVCVTMLFNHGCVYVGPPAGSDYAVVEGGKAFIIVSPTLTVAVPVNVAIGDRVAEAAANAAVGYLKGLPGATTSLNRAEAVQKGVGAGITKAAETGEEVDRKELETFVQQVVSKI